MDFGEIIYNYRSINPKIRMVVGLLLGLIPGIWGYISIGDNLATQKNDLLMKADAAQKKNFQLRKNIAEIPKLQLSISENETKLKKTNKLLPNSFEIDQILHDISASAQSRSVAIRSFEPGKKVFPQKNLDYSEYEIFVKAAGSFADLMTFMDDVTHFDRIMHFRNVSLSHSKKGATADNDESNTNVLELDSKLIVFRSEKYDATKK